MGALRPTKPAGFAFRDRPPTPGELERLRLTLSAFTDGSGALYPKGIGRHLPDWRDFEKSVAAVFGGTMLYAKGVFDVLIPADGSKPYGLSCKTSGERKGMTQLLMELSNSHSYSGSHEA